MRKVHTRVKRKTTRQSSTRMRTSAFTPGEYIRVVPLHYPKPAVPIADLARQSAAEERDFFDGRPAPAPAKAQLTYRRGPLLQNPEVFTIFWGGTWGTTRSSTALMEKLNRFFAHILVSPLIDQLAEYDVPAQAIGHGSVIGTKVISAAAPLGSVTDSTLKAQLRKWLKAKLVPKRTRNTLYFVYLEPGIVSIMGGGRSCQNYCGYHNNIGGAYYAVMPYPTCNGCLGGLSAFDALTGTSSHELCEAITDPVPGSGWYDDVNGEIGDICAWSFKQVGGYTVQLEWSNRQNKCM
jgi:hypothetical protein